MKPSLTVSFNFIFVVNAALEIRAVSLSTEQLENEVSIQPEASLLN
jgi:hypothetical protein